MTTGDRTLDHAMSWFRAGDIKPDPRAMPADQSEMDYRATAMREAFRTPAGQLALDTILQLSVFRAPVDHRLQGKEYGRYAQMRQGQDQIAAAILAYLDHAERLERKANAPAPVSADEPPDVFAGSGGRLGGEPDRPGGDGDDWLAGLGGDAGVAVR